MRWLYFSTECHVCVCGYRCGCACARLLRACLEGCNSAQVPAPSISGFMNEVVWYQVHIKSLLWCTDRTFFVSSRETRRLSSVHNTRGLWQSCLQWSLWSAPGCGDRQQQYLRGVPISIDVDQPTLMRRTGARRMLSPVCRIEKENGLPACEY